jgi:hypothetical protein
MASVLSVGFAVPAAAGEAADAGVARWTAATFPAGAASLTGVTKPDPSTTWAAGFRLVQEGKGLKFSPVVYAKSDLGGGPWTEIPTAPGETGRVNAITSTSAKDAWLVGDQKGREPGAGIMTQHWDGSSWTAVEAPTAPESIHGGLLGVAAVGPTDVWAAGWLQIQDSATPDPDGGPTRIESHDEGLITHWDGQRWTRVPLPMPYASWSLNGISASGPNDVWAVGNGLGEDDKPLVLHYDGTAWSAMPTPPFGGLYGEFHGVVAKAPNDVWATGRSVLDENDSGHALVMHWDGTSWTRIGVPADAGPMYGVAAAPGGIATVGMTADREHGYGLRVIGGYAVSLGIPANLPDGRGFSPWSVGVDRWTGRTTVVGALDNPVQGLPDPLLLTGRS